MNVKEMKEFLQDYDDDMEIVTTSYEFRTGVRTYSKAEFYEDDVSIVNDEIVECKEGDGGNHFVLVIG